MGTRPLPECETRPPATGGADDVLSALRRDVARLVGRPAGTIGDHDDLLDLGLDSIRLMSLLQTWSRPGLELDLVDFVEDPRLASWASKIIADPTERASSGC